MTGPPLAACVVCGSSTTWRDPITGAPVHRRCAPRLPVTRRTCGRCGLEDTRTVCDHATGVELCPACCLEVAGHHPHRTEVHA